ncbi:hypothetical protein ACEQ8H_008109 [Pleosporales sp. CAS-2024a]
MRFSPVLLLAPLVALASAAPNQLTTRTNDQIAAAIRYAAMADDCSLIKCAEVLANVACITAALVFEPETAGASTAAVIACVKEGLGEHSGLASSRRGFLIIGLFALRLTKRMIQGLDDYPERNADVAWLANFLAAYPLEYGLARVAGRRQDDYVASYPGVVSRMKRQPRYPRRFMQMNPDASRHQGQGAREMTDGKWLVERLDMIDFCDAAGEWGSTVPIPAHEADRMIALAAQRRIADLDEAPPSSRSTSALLTNANDMVPTHSSAALFGLPRELRNEIYQYLWDGKRILQRYKSRKYIVMYGDQGDWDSDDDQDMTACWLLTSKQMLVEGVAEFHRRSIWMFESWGETLSSEYVFPLITCGLVHEQHLFLAPKNGHGTGLWFFRDVPYEMLGDPSLPHVIALGASTVHLIDIMTESSTTHDSVRKIRFILDLHDKHLRHVRSDADRRHPANHLPDVMFDFSDLKRLSRHRRLETFEVDIQVYKDGLMRNSANLDQAMANLMTELAVVGKALIPDGEAVQSDAGPNWPLVRGVKRFKFVAKAPPRLCHHGRARRRLIDPK